MNDGLIHGVTAARAANDMLSWIAESGASAYKVYRGLISGLPDYGTCYRVGVTDTTIEIAEDPPPGEGYFYLVSGEFGAGEGGLGFDSQGTPRTVTTSCP